MGHPPNLPGDPWWWIQRIVRTGCAALGRRNSVWRGAGPRGEAAGPHGSLVLSGGTDFLPQAVVFSPLEVSLVAVWVAVGLLPTH